MTIENIIGLLTGETKITAYRVLKIKKLEFWWVRDKDKKHFPVGRSHVACKRIFWNKNN
jgi:hypothetical protein